MVWGGGLLAQMGVLDFAGGIVVHATAGMAALASVIFVGKRKVANEPHNLPLVAIGTALLWFGWYGFNAGSELQVNAITSLAFINTDIAASFAALVWMIIDWSRHKKPKFLGLLTGAVAGLATITPAAGYVTTSSSVIIGCLAGCVCYLAVELKNKFEWDDALDVWGVHGVGGMFGTIMLGVFATTAVNSSGANGLLLGGVGFFFKETIVILAVGLYAFLFSYFALKVINVFIRVKATEEEEEEGLDMALHGEIAYEEGAF
jgi:Amt family ammonium transporter